MPSSVLTELKRRRIFNKGRLELHDPFAKDLKKVGILHSPEEWQLEWPSQSVPESIFIYGTNSNGQLLLLNLKWNPTDESATLQMIFQNEDGESYCANEQDDIKLIDNEAAKEYRIGGLVIEILNPFRHLRIKFRGFLLNQKTNQLVFANFRLHWYCLSKPFDFTRNYNDQLFTSELKQNKILSIDLEDRIEQLGQIKGTIQFEDDPQKVVYLWGCRCKSFFSKPEQNVSATRIFGYSTKGMAFHVGNVQFPNGLKYHYGYGYWSISVAVAFSSISSTSSIDSIFEESQINAHNIKCCIESQKRNFDVDIELGEIISGFSNVIKCNLKLNDQTGSAFVIKDKPFDGFHQQEIARQANQLFSSAMVIPINDEECQSVACSGGKGSSLSRLYKLSQYYKEFIVPQGVVVTTNAFTLLLSESSSILDDIKHLEQVSCCLDRDEFEVKKSCEKLVKNINAEPIPIKIKDEIHKQLISLFGNDYEMILFAIRSSAVGEDSSEMSAAGQMSTYLGIKGLDELCKAVVNCWASQFQLIAVEYKRGYGQPINSPMAVIIQQMVDSEKAGVMFTCDPVTGDERKVVITANYGLGESVVSAIADPDMIRVTVDIEANSLKRERKIKEIESIKFGKKLKSIKLNEVGGTFEIENEQDEACCLSEEEITKLAKISIEIHKSYGFPCDIEWGISNNSIYMLQCRPVTGLDTYNEWELFHESDTGQSSETELYSRANFGEIFPGATSELTATWVMSTWMVSTMKLLVSLTPNFDASVFDTAYYVPTGGSFYNVLFVSLKSGNPLFTMDRESALSKCFMLSFFGRTIQDEDLFEVNKERASQTNTPVTKKLYVAKNLLSLVMNAGSKLKERRSQILNLDLLKDKKFKTSEELFNHICTNSIPLITLTMDMYGRVSFTTGANNAMLFSLLSHKNDDDVHDFSLLLSSANDVVSVEIPNLLKEVAAAIEDPSEFCRKTDEEALKFLQTDIALCCIKFRSLLETYGHRGLKEFDLAALPWGDDPLPLVRNLKMMLSSGTFKQQPKQEKSIDDLIESMKTPLSKSKKFMLKRFLLPRCKTSCGRREQAKWLWIYTINVFRKAFWQLAKMLVAEGRLPSADLMFHLRFEELGRFITDRDPKLVALAKQRKRIFPKKDALIFSENVQAPEMKPRNDSNNDFSSIDVSSGIKGLPICLGKVKSRVCVAMTLQDAQQIKPGDILITYGTDVGWSPFYPLLSGLVTEIGGLISHGAVIAREYGLPCLVAVENACQLFKTGDMVLLDAEKGEIVKIESDENDVN